MIQRLLKIRLIQLKRISQDIGIFRSLFLLALFIFFILFLYVKIQDSSYQILLIAAYGLSLLSLHIKREDRLFLRTYAQDLYLIFLSEYLLLSLPILVIMLLIEAWFPLAGFVGFLLLLPLLNIDLSKRSINSIFQRLIPSDNFEWKSGFRKNLFMIVSLWFLGLFTSFFIGSVPVVIFLLSIIILNFYNEPEPLSILLASQRSVRQFLKQKIGKHLILFAAFLFPLILAFAIFHTDLYYIPLIEAVVFMVLLVYVILLKYAFYIPNEKSGATQIFSNLAIISIFVLVFIPLILGLSGRFIFKAHSNLKNYLDADNS